MGDPCFAKVKGWIPYPARITAIKNSGKKLKFKVLFYETDETNEVASDCVWPVTPDTVKKLVTPKTLKRKYFLPAFDQLRKFHKIEIPFKDDSEQEIGSDKKVDKEIAKCPFGEESDSEQEIESDKGVEKEIAKCTIGEESQPNEIVDILPEHLSSDDEFDLDFYNLKMTVKKPKSKTPKVQPQISTIGQGETEHGGEGDSSSGAAEAKDDGDQDATRQGDSTAVPEKSWTCDDCGLEVLGDKAFLNHVIDHAVAEKAAGINNKPGIETTVTVMDNLISQETAPPSSSRKVKFKGAAKTKSAKTIVAKTKAKVSKKTSVQVKENQEKVQKKSKTKPVKAKKSKTLRESEMDTNDAFKDKIVCKDDNSYHCRFCPLFVTSVNLLARSHAQSCGGKKKLGRHAKKLTCGECGGVFTGKLNMMKHIKESHTLPSYQCSICLRMFKKRLHYRRHLKVHDKERTVSCFFCPKQFQFESYRSRHVQRVHMKKLKPIHKEPAKTGDEDKVVIVGVDQTEEKYGDNYFWQYEVSFPNTEKTSKLLHLPVPSDGSQDGFVIGVIGGNNGEERVFVAGSKIRSCLMIL